CRIRERGSMDLRGYQIEGAAVERRPHLDDGGAAETWGRAYERVEAGLPHGTIASKSLSARLGFRFDYVRKTFVPSSIDSGPAAPLVCARADLDLLAGAYTNAAKRSREILSAHPASIKLNWRLWFLLKVPHARYRSLEIRQLRAALSWRFIRRRGRDLPPLARGLPRPGRRFRIRGHHGRAHGRGGGCAGSGLPRSHRRLCRHRRAEDGCVARGLTAQLRNPLAHDRSPRDRAHCRRLLH